MPSTRTVLHFITATHFWFACYYDWYYVKVPVEVHPMGHSFGQSGKLKFLTYWDALLQSTFFTICTLNDVIGTNEDLIRNKPFIRVLKDGLLTCLAFPLSMFVGISFWALYAVDRELIFPKAIDEFFPSWLNHVMHTNIMVFVLIELVTSFCKYPSRKVGCTILTVFMMVYLVWVHIIHAYSGIWVYPVLDVLNFPLRIVFFLTLLGFALSMYVLGEKLNSLIWSKRLRELESMKKKVK